MVIYLHLVDVMVNVCLNVDDLLHGYTAVSYSKLTSETRLFNPKAPQDRRNNSHPFSGAGYIYWFQGFRNCLVITLSTHRNAPGEDVENAAKPTMKHSGRLAPHHLHPAISSWTARIVGVGFYLIIKSMKCCILFRGWGMIETQPEQTHFGGLEDLGEKSKKTYLRHNDVKAMHQHLKILRKVGTILDFFVPT